MKILIEPKLSPPPKALLRPFSPLTVNDWENIKQPPLFQFQDACMSHTSETKSFGNIFVRKKKQWARLEGLQQHLMQNTSARGTTLVPTVQRGMDYFRG